MNAVKDLILSSKIKPLPLEKPVVIQFPVNDICNAHCQMCHIWKNKLDYQISPSELDAALQNDLYSEVTSVGVNGGEPTLRKDLAELVEVLFRRLPKLKSISLITNALVPKKVIPAIDSVGHVVHKNHGKLDVMVSLDGVGEIHDRVRGRKGNFAAALEVIDYIKASILVTSCRLGCTIIKENVYGLHDLHDFALNKDIYIKYRLGVPHQRLYTQDIKEPFELSLSDKIHISEFLEGVIQHYEPSEKQKHFYRSLVDQIIHNAPRKAGCDWQHRGATISARAELLYCAIESKTLGFITAGKSAELYFGNQSHLNDIIRNKCDMCTHDYTGIPPTPVLLMHYVTEINKRLGISSIKLTENKGTIIAKNIVRKFNFNKRLIRLGVGEATISPASITKRKPDINSPHRIMICGWYGTETVGDKAILGGVITSLRKIYGNPSLHLTSLEPYITKATASQMHELDGAVIYNVDDGIAKAAEMDLVVFGGGPIMALGQLAEMLAIFENAAKSNVPTVLAGCGVGPLGSKYHNNAIKRLLELSSLRIYRDRKSFDHAQALGVNIENDFIAEDPAFTWLNEKEKTYYPGSSNINHDRIKLILGLRDWPYKQYAPDMSPDEVKPIKNHFEAQVLKALSNLLNQYPDLLIIPYPMCTNHFGDDDRWYYRNLFRNNIALQKSLDRSVMSRELTPDETYNIFREADIALTMRFHSLVFALGIGIPAVAIDYTMGKGKVSSLASQYNIPHYSLDDISAESISTSLISAIENRANGADTIKATSPTFTHILRTALNSLGNV